MSCVWTRLFPAFRRRRQQSPNAFVAPSMPSSNNQNQTSLDQLTPKDDTEFPFLGCLAQQGSCTLIVPNVPIDIDLGLLDSFVCNLNGFISRRYSNTEGKADSLDVVVNFGTAAEAAMALASQPTVSIGNGQRRSLEFANNEEPETLLYSEVVCKRVKVEKPQLPPPQCQICADELPGLYSTPCFFCKSVWCHECLGNQFRSALNDQERFPAKCCGRVLHYDVAKSIISDEDHQKYQTRFEQHNTTKPIYCANATCSTFLPARIVKPDNRGRVRCPTCSCVTCKHCRVVVEPIEAVSHKCATADETTALLKQFSYKRCPRCNAGIAKMYGCSHVRCSCGAHWCWDCQRPIQVCWSRPCERAREDGEETDDYNMPEDSDDEAEASAQNPESETSEAVREESPAENAEQVQVHIIETTAENHTENEAHETPVEQPMESVDNVDAAVAVAADTTVPPIEPVSATNSAPPEPVVNLDGFDADNWEYGSFDFGDEPVDESWDTWGCLHRFAKVRDGLILKNMKHWLPDTSLLTGTSEKCVKQVDCLRCFKTIVFGDERFVSHQSSSSAISSKSMPGTFPDKVEPNAQKNKKSEDPWKMYNCGRCGLFYCVACKKTALKQTQKMLERNTAS